MPSENRTVLSTARGSPPPVAHGPAPLPFFARTRTRTGWFRSPVIACAASGGSDSVRLAATQPASGLPPAPAVAPAEAE